MHQRIRMLIVGVALPFLFASGVRPVAAQQPGPTGDYPRVDIEQGFRLFGGVCAGCHGSNGDSIPNANLRSGQFRQAKSDADLQRVIRSGIAGTPMPPHSALTNAELTALVAYLRNMRDFDAGTVTLGDKDRGRGIFQGKGQCETCHRVQGRGARTAPDLSAIASVRSPAAIERSLVDPNGSMLPVNRSIRATRADGTVVTGRRLNEDTFTVQIIDDHERLVSLDKSTLRRYEVLQASPMPSYREKLTRQELADLVAYVVSLKGL